jgi:hypothetical protein
MDLGKALELLSSRFEYGALEASVDPAAFIVRVVEEIDRLQKENAKLKEALSAEKNAAHYRKHGGASVQPTPGAEDNIVLWQHKETGRTCALPRGKDPGTGWLVFGQPAQAEHDLLREETENRGIVSREGSL